MTAERKKRILFLVNHDVVIYNFRKEMVEAFLDEGHEVIISSPYGERIDDLIKMGASFREISIDRHGMNPVKELKLISDYKKLISNVEPDIILSFTIKPNIYGSIAAKKYGIPVVANVTGLGTSIQNGGIKQKISLGLYRNALSKAQKVFFQNDSDLKFMLDEKVLKCENYEVLPGSGVNLVQHCYEEYPGEDGQIIFSVFGRIMKDKGTDELIEAAKLVKQNGINALFRVIGFFDDDYEQRVRNAVNDGLIEYIEQQRDVHPLMKSSHAIIQPSHHEGMSNVLLEAAATGRPVIASDIPGCRETFIEGESGFGFEVGNARSLAEAIIRFSTVSYDEKREMGKKGRTLMEQKFDRNIVIDKYRKEIERV